MSNETLTKVGKFNSEGINAFSKLLRLPITEAQEAVSELLQNEALCDFLECEMEIRPVNTRLELAEILYSSFEKAQLEPSSYSDQGLWSWLAARWMNVLFLNSGRSVRIGEQARWILDKQKSRYYRHLLAGPYFIYRHHFPSPEKALSILCGSPIVPGELVGQVAATSDIAFSVGAEIATLLYVDPKTGRAKKGSGGIGPGSPRRLTAAYLNQIDLTIDYRGMTASQILDLLPSEFDRFK